MVGYGGQVSLSGRRTGCMLLELLAGQRIHLTRETPTDHTGRHRLPSCVFSGRLSAILLRSPHRDCEEYS